MDNLCLCISNDKSYIKVLYVEYIDNEFGRQTKISYYKNHKNHKNNDNTIVFEGWLSLENIRDNLYSYLDIQTTEI